MGIFNIEILTWAGIVFCISQAAMLSGLNLAFFSVSRLRLEIEAENNNKHARKVLQLRSDSNFLLASILWANVGVNVLLTLLSNSVLAGVGAFVFSTVIITLLGEIFPQAYFSRHAVKMAAVLSPVLRIYQIIFFPVAKLTALLLDAWLGKDSIQYFREQNLIQLIQKHVEKNADIGYVEGIGAINFLSFDDLFVYQEGEPVDPLSIIKIRFEEGKPVFPVYTVSRDDAFLQRIQRSQKKWIIFIDNDNKPQLVMDADAFLRSSFFDKEVSEPRAFMHKPVVIYNPKVSLENVIRELSLDAEHQEDDVIDKDIVLFWGRKKRIITGADILGRLLRGIVKRRKKWLY